MGGSLQPGLIVEAYQKAIFPWPDPDVPQVIWASPRERGVLFCEELHLGKSFARHLRRENFRCTLNQVFSEVIAHCQQIARPHQSGTWITDAMKQAYEQLHREGIAHSVEVWKDSKLVGGLYGVCVDKIFSAESMFYLESHASKAALVHLVNELKKVDIRFVDIQMLTPVTESLGARLIPRAQFLSLLKTARHPGWRLPWT